MKNVLTSSLVALTVLATMTTAQAQERLLIGATSSAAPHYGYFVAVNQIINSSLEGVSSSVVETGATVDNLRRLSRGQIDMGLVTTNTGYQAYAGLEDFEDRRVDSRLLWVYTVAPQIVVVREDSGVSELTGLDGVRFNPGGTGSSTEKTTEAVFDALGISPDYVRGSTSNMVDALKDNRIVGHARSGAGNRLDGATMDVATLTPLRVLSLNDDQVGILRETMPDISVIDIPAGAGEGVPAFKTWAFGVAVHATPDMEEDVAYRIVKAVMENPEPQGQAFAGARDVDFEQLTLTVGTIPLHPGAARYFEERGLDIPDALKPID